MFTLDKLLLQRMREDRDNVRKGIGSRLLQVPHRQEELVIALPLSDLKQSSDALQTGLLHLANQSASPVSIYKNFKNERHVITPKKFKK